MTAKIHRPRSFFDSHSLLKANRVPHPGENNTILQCNLCSDNVQSQIRLVEKMGALDHTTIFLPLLPEGGEGRGGGQLFLNPNSEAGLSVAATPRRRKVPATPSSPVAAVIMPLPEKMLRGRRYHPAATRRRRYFRLTASEFGLNSNPMILVAADVSPLRLF
jgi:hypothetical protein